jgi:pectin-derived oligosaccharide transport system permease protein
MMRPASRVSAAGRRLRAAARRNLTAYAFLLPWLVGFIGLTAGPMVASFVLAFTSFDLLSAPHWIGVANFVDMFQDDRWWNAVKVTFTYVVLQVPLKIAFALVIALLLNRRVGAISLYRALYYLPSLLGGSVAIAVLWRHLFGDTGLVNDFFRAFGWKDPPFWIVDPRFALDTIVLLGVWQFGASMIIFLAGLRQIPHELYEAAVMDGAGSFAQFRSVTVPQLTPLIFFNLVLQMIHSFQAFTPAYVVSGGTGGPLDHTLFYTLYLYEMGFERLSLGYASSMAWVLLVAIAVFTAVMFATSDRWVYYQEGQR